MNYYQPVVVTRSVSASRRRVKLLPIATFCIIILISIFLILIVCFYFYPEICRLSEMLRNLEEKSTVLLEIQKEVDTAEHEINLLQTDTQYLEIIARDSLDLMKKGETIFRFYPSKNLAKKTYE